ncbi:MAG: hypothetical protein K8R59_02505, partial [Thermoanaerobaculales bacterium]|nr:hypothetical protein [Thermoanaerobaculales bacterium]
MEANWRDWTETQLDGLGRAALVHRPDGADLETTFAGDTTTTTTRDVATSISTADTLATTTVTDALGRLRLLEEQETSTNTYVTKYEYDIGDRLTDIAL